ncbi:hypothetical protein RRG08_011380 [Elysia crispata]|uniref:Uncharacterized protein n=1 Tax=Elysia crispata TaxID=231223 RepID=A0AAE0ZLK0_9GAST|nr:hypothetical protein RRG08_011380 [Elysia crispata]
MNDEDTKQIPIVIERGQEMVTGRRAANCFIDTYEEVSSIQVPDERRREIYKEIKEHQVQPNPDYMNIPFNARFRSPQPPPQGKCSSRTKIGKSDCYVQDTCVGTIYEDLARCCRAKN